MPFALPKRKHALVCLSTTLSLLLLALSAWALPRAFRLHQTTTIRSLEAPAAAFLAQVCPNSHLEVVQEFPLRMVVTAEAEEARLRQLEPALRHLYGIETLRGEDLLVVPGRPPFYWSDHLSLAGAVALAALLLMLPGLQSFAQALARLWRNRPVSPPRYRLAGGRLRRMARRLWAKPTPRRGPSGVPRPPVHGWVLILNILSCYPKAVVEEILAAMPEREREEGRRRLLSKGASSPAILRQCLHYFAAQLAGHEPVPAGGDAALFAAVLVAEIHRAGTFRGRRRIFSCPVCDEVFMDEESLRRHELTHGSSAQPVAPVRQVPAPPRAPGSARRKPSRLSKGLLFVALAVLTGFTSYGLARRVQSTQPVRGLASWLKDDLKSLVDSPTVVAVMEREGKLSALVAADAPLHSLIRERARALGLEPAHVLCLDWEPTSALWPWSLLLLPGVLALVRRIRRRPVVVAAPPLPLPVPSSPPPREKPTESILDRIRVRELQVDIGRGLLGLVDPNQGARLLERVTSIRRHIAMELGLVVPHVLFRDNLQVKPNAYVFLLRGVEVGRGEVQVNQFLAIGPEEKLKNLRGINTVDPTYGMPGVWISPEQRGGAERLGCMIFDPVSVVATHLTEVVRRSGPELLTFQAAHELLGAANLGVALSKLEERGIDLVRLWQTLRGLLRERVSIRDLQSICEGLLSVAELQLDDAGLLDYARRALGSAIAQEYKNNEGKIQCWSVPQTLQEDILAGSRLEDVKEWLAEISLRSKGRGLQPIFVSEPSVRPLLFALLPEPSGVSLSTAEIPPHLLNNNLTD